MKRTTRDWLVLLMVLLLSCTVIALSARAAELGSRPPSWEPRVIAGKELAPTGSLLSSEQPGQPWRTLARDAAVYSRDLLLALPGMKARLETAPSGVELTLWGNLPQLSDFSGLESAVILHDSRAFDADFTLHRGRVLVTNRKTSGSARVWVRVDGAAFQLTLAEPDDAVCLGLNSFWPRGVPFTPPPKPEESPVRTMNMLVVKGQVDVKVGGGLFSLSAPPGLAFFHWDSINGPDAAPRHRRELEAWANPDRKPTANAKAIQGTAARYQALIRDRDPHTALADLLAAAAKESDREKARAEAEFAVYGLAAINDIDRVMQALDDAGHAEARKAASVALRRWIGKDARRDRLLYHFLIERLSYSEAQSATVLQLLHTAFAPEEPVTYETLIAYLRHEKLAIRELAWRQLSHLVPEDIIVPYDPAASIDERKKACAAWKVLIPSGSIPSRKVKEN
jgi:hypothetical protein